MAKRHISDQETVKNRETERFTKAYGLFVCSSGKSSRPYTDDDIELMSGGLILSRTSRAYRSGTSLPEAWRLMLLVSILGAGFLNRLVEGYGIAGAYDVEGEGPGVAQINTYMTGLTHHLAKGMEDGRLDHREEAEFKKQLGQFMSLASLYLSGTRNQRGE